MNIDLEIESARTLSTVRELSENATLRPAPNTLRCVPWQEFALLPVSAFKVRINKKIAIRVLLDSLSNPAKI